MKITRKQLRQLILEFKMNDAPTAPNFNIDISDIIKGGSGFPPPPDDPGDRGGRGGGSSCDDPADPAGKFDTAYNVTLDAFGEYLSKTAQITEFDYVDRLLDDDIISIEDISNYGHVIDFLSDGLLYDISHALCKGKLTQDMLPAAFHDPRRYV